MYNFKVNFANHLLFVYMPVGGLLFGEIWKSKERGVKETLFWSALFVLNYLQMIVVFKWLSPQYYSDELYFVSFMYGILLLVLCLLFDDMFLKSRFCSFICKNSLSVYLLQMTWGSGIMQLLTNWKVPFTAAFLITVVAVILLSCVHTKLVGLIPISRRNQKYETGHSI